LIKRGLWIGIVGCVVATAAACDSDMDKRLLGAISSVADEVTIGEAEVVAKCKTGDLAKVPVAELGLDMFGMADIEKQEAVAKKLMATCEAIGKKKREAERVTKLFADVATERDLDISGKEIDEARKIVCDSLAKDLPLKGDKRTEMVTRHRVDYGCEDPGEPELGPERYWQVEREKGTVYLKISSEEKDGAASDRFTIRCKGGKKLDAYFATTSRLKKGKISVTADNKRGKWASNLSKSKKSIFLKKPAKDLKLLKGKKTMQVRYPARRKTVATFDIEGFTAAAKNLKGRCRL
jgi:hypothetical protein